MANIAILVGNTEYQNLCSLACCSEDLAAVKELLDATGKFGSTEVVLNSASSDLKERIRTIIDAHTSVEEIFFYFTGHGFHHDSEFFFCATDFDHRRPHETGLSNSDLHKLLRSPDADLVVKIIDACCSGTLLIKSDEPVIQTNKSGFKNLIQIASCLDSQNSLTGDPLSVFTEKFRAATLRKREGVVYYTDVIDSLRDDFLDNDGQTPHFVSQGTGREQFVDSAARLNGLRTRLSNRESDTATESITIATQRQLSPFEILERAETRFAKKELAQGFISCFFDKVREKASSDSSFEQLFSMEFVVHPDFEEATTRAFIIRVLAKEKRPDNFVTATISYEARKRNPFGIAGTIASFFDNDSVAANYDLRLNCSLNKVQLKITLTPKFITLKRFVLVVTCAPSLETCYIMEMLTQHSLTDWGVFDFSGDEVVRRWYKRKWTDSCDDIVESIWQKIKETVQERIDATVKSLTE